MLSSYNYSIVYKPEKYIQKVHCFSSLPLGDTPGGKNVPFPGETVLLET